MIKNKKMLIVRSIKKVILLFLMLAAALVLLPLIDAKAEGNTSKHYDCGDFAVDYNVVSAWDEGYNAQITITNTSDTDIENWAFLFDHPQDIYGAWNASVSDSKGKYIIMSNNVYNHIISVGSSVTFGFTVSGDIYYPDNFFYASVGTSVDKELFDISYDVTYNNNNEYGLNVSITNLSESTIEEWKLQFDFDGAIDNIWNAQVISSDEKNHYIHNDENAYIYPSQTVTFGLSIVSDEDIDSIFNKCELEQVHRFNCNELGIPSQGLIIDSEGNAYDMEWDSDSNEIPQVYSYTDIPLDEILDLNVRYSVSPIGAIYFDMPDLNGYANITTDLLESPDLVLRLDLDENVLELIPFSCDDVSCSFRISQDSIIIPVKYISETEESTPALYAMPRNSDISKMFNILSNSDGKVEVDLTEMYDRYHRGLLSDLVYGPFNVKVNIGGNIETFVLDNNTKTFSFESENGGIVNVRVYCKNFGFIDDFVWEQNIYVQRDITISESKKNELLEKYAPIVVFNSDEEYAPMTIDDIFSQIKTKTSIKNCCFNTIFGDEYVDTDKLLTFMAYNGESAYLLDWHSLPLNNGSKSFKNIKGDFSNSVVYSYFQSDEKYYYLTYYFFYGYDKKLILGAGCHNLDRESMTVVLDKSFEPISVIVGGHLDDTNIKYNGEKDFEWTHERVKSDYNEYISDFSQGHPIVYIEKDQHCVMPLPGEYKAGIDKVAGLTEDIYNLGGMINSSLIKAIFPSTFSTSSADINYYSTQGLNIDQMYGSNPLNFCGYWVDVFGSQNANFPPFLKRDFDKSAWFSEATVFDPNDTNMVKLSDLTKRSQEQFDNSYLFSLGTVQNFRCDTATGDVKLSWNAIQGVSGYEIIRSGNGTNRTYYYVNSDENSFTDQSLEASVKYNYSIRAFYDSDKSKYGESGTVRFFNIPAEIRGVSIDSGLGKVVLDVRDASTNLPLKNVNVYVDGKLVGTTTNQLFTVKLLPGRMHSITTKCDGYIDVNYNEIVVSKNETLSLETLMQVPFDENARFGNVSITIRNAINNYAMPDIAFAIRKGMNTTTGDVLMTATSDSSGKVILQSLPSGNYTGVIDDDGYIKTVFNFTVIGGLTRLYEVHVSPVLDDSEIRIVLSWGANPRDLDSHFVGENIHIYYEKKSAKGINLDCDDTNGYGPETITIDTSALPKGTYKYYVHRYAGTGTIGSSNARVSIYCGNSLIKTYYAKSDVTGDWSVFTINTMTNQITDL